MSPTSQDLQLEHANFDGAILTGIAYGINVTLSALAFRQLYSQYRDPSSPQCRILTRVLLAILVILFILSTLNIVGDTSWVQGMFVDDSDFPGGPDAYYLATYTDPRKFMSTVSFLVGVLVNEGLIAYRCMALYNFRIWQILLQVPIFLGCVGTGIYVIIYETTRHVPVPSIACTIFLILMLLMDVELTSFIVGRFLYYRWLLTPSASDSPREVVIWLQSAALSGAFGLTFLITVLKGNAMSGMFLVVQQQVNTIATALVMLRIAWAKNQAEDEDKSHTQSNATNHHRSHSHSTGWDSVIVLERRPATETIVSMKPEDGWETQSKPERDQGAEV